MAKESQDNSSLFEQLGGMQAVEAAVDVFYAYVSNDERISYFFRWVDMEKQSNKMKFFLAYALGSPINYSGKSLKDSHARLVKMGLTDKHFDAVVENLVLTLRELGIAENLIAQVGKIAEGTREDILR
ncbi:group 1 truncated hemoglobin [Chryseolinea sp. H1M3-3]|uniref:group I truncated hemoglobin n=1 Tax=Chryseolinea sp. H1M3-3 TaxID=3034144 RepID=UPI0023EC2628|nr:group 1 truncated hemoglobin [Chryseolinea sp. H1M3-3]